MPLSCVTTHAEQVEGILRRSNRRIQFERCKESAYQKEKGTGLKPVPEGGRLPRAQWEGLGSRDTQGREEGRRDRRRERLFKGLRLGDSRGRGNRKQRS